MSVGEWLVATHEAGHAVAAHVLGRAVHMVSILPTDRYEGMTVLGGGEAHPTDRQNLLLPTVLRPAPLRRWTEVSILIALAGPAAAFHLAAPSTDVDHSQDETHARELARSAVWTQAESERLEEATSTLGPFRTDEEDAEKLAWAMAGSDSADAYLDWLRTETRHLVVSPRFRAYVATLVPALLERKTMSGRLVRRVLESPGDPPWNHPAATRL
jgi:hypothetical protein